MQDCMKIASGLNTRVCSRASKEGHPRTPERGKANKPLLHFGVSRCWGSDPHAAINNNAAVSMTAVESDKVNDSG